MPPYYEIKDPLHGNLAGLRGMGRGTLGSGLIAFAVALVPLVPSPAVAAAAAPQPTPGLHFGQGWTTTEAAPTAVDLSRLPAVTPAELKADSTFSRPRLVKDAAAYAAAKRTPKGPKGAAIPQKKAATPAPNAPKAPGAPKVPAGFASAFTGISLNQELSAIGAGAEPSDTQMAAGPTTLMELTNITGQVFHKDGTAAGALFRLSTFFAFPTGYFPGDPRVVFDPSTQRWYATALGFNSVGGSQVRLMVSASSNPISTWYRYLIYSSSTLLCDQPKLGYSSDKLIVGCTDFNLSLSPPNDFIGGVIIAVNKSRALAGATVLVGYYGPKPGLFGLVPAQNVDPGQRGYVVFNFGPDPTVPAQFDSALITVDGNPQAGFGPGNVNGFLIPMTATTVPPGAQQNGSGTTIDTGDDRFMSAVLKGGEIWTSGGTGCIPSGDTLARACVKILKLGVAGNTNDLDTTTGMVGKYLYYPTLGLDANNNAAIDYSFSSAADSPSHGAMIQRSTDTTPTDRGLIQVGAGSYAGSRWGDYGAAATDPVEPTRVWVAGEYSDGTTTFTHPNWNTGFGAIDFTTLQLSVTGIGFGPQLVGSASAAQTLTVTNTGDADVAVTATLADSSQFQAKVNNCLSVTLVPTGTCDAQFVFNPTSPGDKIARFNVSAPNYGPLPLVLNGTALDPTCGATAISTDVTSPQFIGATVTLNATSTGCPNASPLYWFRLRSPAGVWSTLQSYSPSASAPWNTTPYAPGTYLIAVYVKDAASTKLYDTYAWGTFVIQINYCTATNIGTDKTSPRPPGTTITFTATRVGCPNVLYEWWLNKAGIWTIVAGHDFAHSTDTFIWNTTGLPNGTYQIGVWAKQAGSTKRYDAFAFITYTLVVTTVTQTKCQAVNITPTPPSPSDAGTIVTLTAAVTSCSNPQFKWWVRDIAAVWHIVKDYPVGTSTYNWTATTPGTYLLGIWVRQTGSLARYEAFSFITYTLSIPPATQRCSAVNISQSLPSPQTPGTTVTFTGTAAGCATASYRWFVAAPGGALVQSQAYGSNTFNWNTTGLAPGFYQIAVWARRTGSTASYDAFAQVSFDIRKNNVPCTSFTLNSTPSQIASGAIGLTPTPAGCLPVSIFHFYVRHGNTGAFTQVTTFGGPLGLSLAGYAGGWWTVMVLAEDSTWPGVFDGTVYSDFEVN